MLLMPHQRFQMIHSELLLAYIHPLAKKALLPRSTGR
jgi:hypothetical protein